MVPTRTNVLPSNHQGHSLLTADIFVPQSYELVNQFEVDALRKQGPDLLPPAISRTKKSGWFDLHAGTDYGQGLE